MSAGFSSPRSQNSEAILCIGSNVDNAAILIAAALSRLSLLGEIDTSDVYPSGSGYLNCVASLRTSLPVQSLVDEAKIIEKELGRTPIDKASGIVPIDIDVVVYDGVILRPADASSIYFTTGLQTLKNANHTRV